VFQLSVSVGNAAPLSHANQLPLPILYSAADHESDSCKWRYSKCPVLNPLPQFSQLISVLILLSDNLSHSISLAKKLINFSCSLRQNY